MRKAAEHNGYMTLKIELVQTKITRTIVVPEHMTLEDLNDAIQAVMGWYDAHLWQFSDKRRDGVIYELPHEDDGFPPFSKRLTVDASKVSLRSVLPNRGAKLYYEYDFGDSWDHVITRQADPKTPEIACVKSQGPDGIEDFGGQWRLAAFIETMQTNPDCEEFAEIREWAGLRTAESLKRYLDGETVARKTKKLRAALSHVKPPAKPVPGIAKPMSEDEQAQTLCMTFARMVNARIWTILEDAMRKGGTCEFYDPNKDIGAFFLTAFEGLKVKDGRSSYFYTDPSRLTVLPQWVEMYKKHGEEWGKLHEQFDILESYATSAVHLYGVVPIDNLLDDIILRYDPGCDVSHDELSSVLKTRAVTCPQMPFRVSDGLVISEDTFPLSAKDIEANIDAFLKEQSRYSRWYPQTRDDLFLWTEFDSYDVTKGSEEVKRILDAVCRGKNEFVPCETQLAIYRLLEQAVTPENIYDLLLEHRGLPKLQGKAKRELLEAMEDWQHVIHLPLLNGNTMEGIRDRLIQQRQNAVPKIGRNAPCPCGSGKKFKHCCGDFSHKASSNPHG